LEKKWTLLPSDEGKIKSLYDQLHVDHTLCRILINRGLETFDKAKKFFRPNLEDLHSPWLMKDMRKATDRLLEAFEKKEKILVYGDYDVDGTTSVASFYQFLNQVHPASLLEFYIPNRYKEGYGISNAGIEYAHQNEFSLVVCLDCGIKSVELIAKAKELGIDFIICDHHLPGTVIPDAVAILNPKQKDCNFPFKELCGCGVGFKLMTALAECLNLSSESYLQYIDLVAVAIAADIVPIVDENRILAYHGLKKINENPSIGIKAILESSGSQKKLTITNVVFMIAPRVNAAGRMDDAKKAVLLFIENDVERAKELAAMLQSDNTDRRETDSSITKEALEIISNDPNYAHTKSTVLYQPHWHKGVVGIVASRVIESHYKPTIVLTLSEGLVTGSARSVRGFNVYEAIYACKDHLVTFGGHFAAAGLSMLPEKVESFKVDFEKSVSESITEDSLCPEIEMDAEIDFKDIRFPLFRMIAQMEPFGPENMKPVFIAKNVINNGNSRLIKEQHIKFELKQNNDYISGIGFNMVNRFDLLLQNKPIDIVFTLEENEWNGKVSLQLMVLDFKLSA
jgi:single-stranded-DNA-specific exonuclease